MSKTALTLVACITLLWVGLAQAAPTAAQKCEAAKNVAAGKYAACRQTAEKTRVITGDLAKYAAAIARCEATFAKAWQAAIDKAADADPPATCPDEPLVANDYKPLIDANTDAIAKALSGDGLSVCGNAVLDSGEDCDFGTLGGKTCSTATADAKPFGTLACGAGCHFNTSGCHTCAELGGSIVGGSCWFLASAKGTSCTNECASKGLTYDAATKDYAGSDGTSPHCVEVANAIVFNPNWTVQPIGSTGVGCGIFNPPVLVRDGTPTTGEATDSQISRFCACH